MAYDPRFTIISALIGALSALIVLRLRPWVERRLRLDYEKAAFKGELCDLYRHLVANKAVLDSIDLQRGLPLDMHLRKLAIPEDTLLFSDETFRNLPQEWLQRIYELRLMLRNLNIEAEEALRWSRRGDMHQVKALISYMVVKIVLVKGKMSETHLNFFKGPIISLNNKDGRPPSPPLILYKNHIT